MHYPRSALVSLLAVALLIGACGESEDEGSGAPGRGQPKVGDAGPIHVHGLGINPKDRALFVATHTGLFRAGSDERKPQRIADRFQDTMGFTVVGPDHFLGSGHPDGREGLPPFLGLIETRNAGRTWRPISLLGERDFHVLEAKARRIYGFGADFETRRAALLVSDDRGRSWDERTTPEALLSLAIHPTERDRIAVAGERRLYLSSDGGRRWRRLAGDAALLAWPAPARLLAVGQDGEVMRSSNAGRSWREVGEIGGEPAAFEAESPTELYVALHDGTVKRSSDGGASWSVRAMP